MGKNLYKGGNIYIYIAERKNDIRHRLTNFFVFGVGIENFLYYICTYQF